MKPGQNRFRHARKYFGGQGSTGISRKNAPVAHSVTCSTLGLNADHRPWSRRVAAERASLVAACFPGFRRMNSPYGAWFTSPDGTLEVTATWNEQTGFSMVETNVSCTPPRQAKKGIASLQQRIHSQAAAFRQAATVKWTPLS